MKTLNPLFLLGRMMFLVLLLLLQTGSVSAATITWSAAVNIGSNSGETDVSTSGNLLYAYAWGNVNATVNGVAFTGTAATSGNIPSSNPDITLTTSWVYYHNNSGPSSGLTAAYRTMLAGDIDQYSYNAGPQVITLNKLTVGHSYIIQAWISSASDGWNNTAQQLTVTNANGNTVTCYGFGNPANGLGQYTTGTFTANAATQTLAIIGVNYGYPRINSIQVRDTTGGGSPPPTPTGLSATAGNGQVALSWNTSSGATSYNVKRSTTSGGPYTTIASPTTTSYTDTSVNNGTTYYYVVSAVNGSGESANSSQVNATPNSPPPTPTGLSATAGNAQVALSWNASSGATSYNVKRSTTSGGPYTTIASPTTTSYTDTSVNNGTTYYYVVSAVNAAGESANSSQASATPTGPPPTPTGLSATAGNAQVALSWNASSGATSYHVKRSTTSGGPYSTIASPTTTSYTDTSLNNGTTYYYVVSAVNGAGESANSSQVSATPSGGSSSGITWSSAVNIGSNPGEGDITNAGVPLYAYAWRNVSTTVNGVAFTGTAATSGNIPSSNPDITLTTSWTYYHNNSGPTSGLTAAYRTMLAGDIDQYAINSGPQIITLNKLTVGHGYLVQVWISSASDGWNNMAQQLTVTNANGSDVIGYGYGNPANGLGQYTIGTFTASATTQAFAIIAVNYGFPRINAIQVQDTSVAPSTPTGLTAAPGNAQVSLSWNASGGATSYNLKRSTTSGGPYTTIASPTTTSYTDTGVNNGTTYYYVVSAVNSFGQSANSSQVSATPSAIPQPPTGLDASAGNAQVGLNWNASSGATSYNVKRSTTSGGSYSTIASPTTTSYTDTGLNNGTTYYYVVSAVNSFGESANSSQVSATPTTITVPPAAVGAGYTNLMFDDEFNSISTIDTNNTGAPGYNWYVQLPFGGGTVPGTNYTVTNGVLEINFGGHTQGWGLSTWNCTGNGNAFRYGYFEARVHFDPTKGATSAWFPAFWSFPVDHTCSGANHWNELDFFEAYTGGFAPYNGSFVGTVHDWTFNNNTYSNCQNANNFQNTSVDWNQWHILGCLWTPGQISWYLDDNLLMTQQYSATGAPNPCVNCTSGSGCATGLFSIMDSENNFLILGCSEEWPLYVDYVHVWQQ